MKNDIIALRLELKKPMAGGINLFFNDVHVRALLAGLSAVYDEAFIWPGGTHIGVWVTGYNGEFLCHAFRHFQSQNKNYNLLEGDKAVHFFTNIVEGEEWQKIDFAEKLFQLAHAIELAKEADSLRSTLGELVEHGLTTLRHQPEIEGLLNGWRPRKMSGTGTPKVNIEFPELFYRFSIN